MRSDEDSPGALQPGENVCLFLKRVFAEVISDLSPKSMERALVLFHPTYVQSADGEVLDRARFMRLLRVQKSRLASSPKFVWKKLVATVPNNGHVYVTSVHKVSARLKTGSDMLQHVVALIDIDECTGQIIRCDEQTRMETDYNPRPNKFGAGAFEGSGWRRPSVVYERRSSKDRPTFTAPPAKQARSSPEPVTVPPSADDDMSPTAPSDTSDAYAVRLQGIPLKRASKSDLLSDVFDAAVFLDDDKLAVDKCGRSISYASTRIIDDLDDCSSHTSSRPTSIDIGS